MLKKWFASSLEDIIAVLALLLYSLFLWWPTRYLPFYGDAEAFVNQAAKQLLASNFSPLIAVGSDFAHPPLIPFLLALVKTISFNHLLGAHLTILPFIPIFLISLYFIVRKSASSLTALCTAFLLGFLPPFVVETGNIYLDLPAASLTLLAMATYIYGSRFSAFIFLILGVFVKETALLSLPFFFFYPQKNYSIKQKFFFIGGILLFYFSWLLYHFYHTGWLLFSPGSRINERYLQSVFELINTLTKFISGTFWRQYRIFLFLPLLCSVFLVGRLKSKLSSNFLRLLSSFYVLILSVGLFYLLATEYLSRYSLFIISIILILNAITWHTLLLLKFSLKITHMLMVAYTLVVCIVFSSTWHPQSPVMTTYDFRPQEDLSYLDVVRVFLQAGAFLSNFPSQYPLYGTYPENFYFTDPTAGYIPQARQFIDCSQTTLPIPAQSLVIIHPFSPGQIQCRKLLQSQPHQLLANYQSADKWLEIYSFEASSAAVNK